jgi:hypothetical protein
MRKLAGIMGTVVLGVALAVGFGQPEGVSASDVSGGWGCPWASDASTSWQGAPSHGMGRTTFGGARTRGAAQGVRGSNWVHRQGAHCKHGHRYHCRGWL